MFGHRSSDFRVGTPVNAEEGKKERAPLLPVRRASEGSMPNPMRPMRSYSAEYYGATPVLDDGGGFESDTTHNTFQRNPRFTGPRSLEMPSMMSRAYPSIDEFGEAQGAKRVKNFLPRTSATHSAATHTLPANKTIRSSRARKKTAARSKGGEFQAHRRKRRLYFCTIASEIDVEKLADRFQQSHLGLKGQMYDEVLHLYMNSTEELGIPGYEIAHLNNSRPHLQPSSFEHDNKAFLEQAITGIHTIPEATDNEHYSGGSYDGHRSVPFQVSRRLHDDLAEDDLLDVAQVLNPLELTPSNLVRIPSVDDHDLLQSAGLEDKEAIIDPQVQQDDLLSSALFWNYGGKEIFIFEFGAIVFWGYQQSEVDVLLDLAMEYIVKGRLSEAEFEAGEDDMAFVTSFEAESITIANDVIVLPDRTTVKSRLAVSFAIAQSSVLSIFEARIETKIEAYKYIPETLAQLGRVKLSPKELGNMIGEVFVIRHDVNLHSEILDIPDYFWKENTVEPLYRMTAMYLEMEPRTEVLNKRLDLLRELLRLLQHQHENAHAVTLEWIVIWLIVVSVILELMVWVGEVFGINLGE